MNGVMTSTLGIVARMVLPAFFIFAVAQNTCAQRTTAVGRGEWGGQGMILNVTDAGATLQFDCADGTITKQLRMDKRGNFEIPGTLARSGPGPIREDAQGRAVIYKGKVSGKTMTIGVRDAKTGDALGDYTITLGQAVRLHRCL